MFTLNAFVPFHLLAIILVAYETHQLTNTSDLLYLLKHASLKLKFIDVLERDGYACPYR